MPLFRPDNASIRQRKLTINAVPTPMIERSVRSQSTQSSIISSIAVWQYPLLAVALTVTNKQILPNKPSTLPTRSAFPLLSEGREKKSEFAVETDSFQRQSAIETVAQVTLTNCCSLIRWTNFLCESRSLEPGWTWRMTRKQANQVYECPPLD